MDNFSSMNIAVLSHYSFPSGMAGTNRMASLAKGLVEELAADSAQYDAWGIRLHGE